MRKVLQFALFTVLFALAGHLQAQENIGVASYYSDSFQGRKTASGEKYDKQKLTAAHKTLAFGTYLKVTRLDNKSSVTVKVNDRGPYIKGRIVDLSRKAAEALNIVRDGHANVKIEVVSKAEAQTASAGTRPAYNIEAPEVEKPRIESTPVAAEATSPRRETSSPVEKKSPLIVNKAKTPPPAAATPPPAKPAATSSAKKASEAFAPGVSIVRGKDYKDFDLYKVQVLRPERTGYGVQVASLTKYENVLKQVAELQEKWFKNILVSVEPGAEGKPLYKTILGPFPDRATAKSYQKQLKKKKGISGFIVDLSTITYPK